MDIEVEFALEVVGTELSETEVLLAIGRAMRGRGCVLGFIPSDDWREANLPHACKESESCEEQRGPYELIVV